MIEIVIDASAGIRLPDVDEVVHVGMAQAVRLWVEAEHDDVSIMLHDGALEFGRDARWTRRQLGCRSSRRLSQQSQRRAAALSSPCYLCEGSLVDGQGLIGPQGGVNWDHWYPRSLGGPNEPWNLRLVHVVCNERKGDSVLPEAGAAYRAWADDQSASAQLRSH